MFLVVYLVVYQTRLRALADFDELYIFGELFGGHYPHTSCVADSNRSNAVQTGIWYSPRIEFMVFDCAVRLAKNSTLDLPNSCTTAVSVLSSQSSIENKDQREMKSTPDLIALDDRLAIANGHDAVCSNPTFCFLDFELVLELCRLHHPLLHSVPLLATGPLEKMIAYELPFVTHVPGMNAHIRHVFPFCNFRKFASNSSCFLVFIL